MSTEPIAITVTDNIQKGVITSLKAIGTEASKSHKHVEALQKALNTINTSSLSKLTTALGKTSSELNKQTTAQAKLQDATDKSALSAAKLATEQQKAATALARTNKAAADAAAAQSRAAKAALELERAQQRANTSVRSSNDAFASGARQIASYVAAYVSLSSAIGAVDNFTNVRNSLKLTGLEGEKLEQQYQKLKQVALDNFAPMDGLAEVYKKLSFASSDLGLDTEQMNQFIDATALSMRTSGAAAIAQSGALSQLSQALGNTLVQAQEYNSLVDGMYPILLSAANGSSRFGGSVNKLRQAMLDQNLTSKDFVQYILEGRSILQGLANTMDQTLGQAFVNLKTQFIDYIGNQNKANGATTILIGAISLLAQNLNYVIPTIALFGAAWASVAIFNLVTGIISMTKAMVMLTGAMLTNPAVILAAAFVALGVGVLQATGYMDGFLKLLSGGASAIGDVTKELLGIAPASENVNTASTSFDDLNKSAAGTLASLVGTKENATGAGNAIVKIGEDGTPAVKTTETAVDNLNVSLDNSVSKANALTRALREAATASKLLQDSDVVKGGQTTNPPRAGNSNSTNWTSLPGFATGGSFKVGGASGVDNNLVSFMASKGEEVRILTRGQQQEESNRSKINGRPVSVNVNIINPQDADSFRRSRGQMESSLASAVMSGMRSQ